MKLGELSDDRGQVWRDWVKDHPSASVPGPIQGIANYEAAYDYLVTTLRHHHRTRPGISEMLRRAEKIKCEEEEWVIRSD